MERPDHSFVQNVVGANVRKYRLERNWSQQDLSMRLQLRKTYICRGSISRIERQERSVADYELWTLAEVFGVSIYDLYKTETK